MTEKERYESLKKRAEAVNNLIARIEGERQAYIKKLKEMGFKGIQEVKQYIQNKEAENEKKKIALIAKLDEYEKIIEEVERQLGV